MTCRANLLLAICTGVRMSVVQYSMEVSKTDWLKTWLLPKKASERLVVGVLVGVSYAIGYCDVHTSSWHHVPRHCGG